MPQKHDNYTRKVFDGIGEGGGGKSDYKDCFRSQKENTNFSLKVFKVDKKFILMLSFF